MDFPDAKDYSFYFTFQSGYIQMFLGKKMYCILKIFTFQSGYIQMLFNRWERFKQLRLYIPIWLYSNYIITILS